MTALITRIVDMPQPIKVEIASQRDGAHEYAYSKPQRKGQRREPAADDVEFISERIGWLPFAAPSGSTLFSEQPINNPVSFRRLRVNLCVEDDWVGRLVN